jgi:septal ring factor EnvC (AmiA/AmiB activator)
MQPGPERLAAVLKGGQAPAAAPAGGPPAAVAKSLTIEKEESNNEEKVKSLINTVMAAKHEDLTKSLAPLKELFESTSTRADELKKELDAAKAELETTKKSLADSVKKHEDLGKQVSNLEKALFGGKPATKQGANIPPRQNTQVSEKTQKGLAIFSGVLGSLCSQPTK